ncbi:MAG: S8 family serine peptidase, partial [Candidatus Nanopelagicales bacterium]
LAAPGADLLAAGRNGNPVFKTGTSFAAPMVSGAAAILLSARPTATAAEVKGALLAGATRSSATANRVAAGSLNTAASLDALAQ